MKSFDQQVADWARTKPANLEYDNMSGCNCAIAQFLKESGMASDPVVGGFKWSDGEGGERHKYSGRIVDAIHSYPCTFGALADRLSS